MKLKTISFAIVILLLATGCRKDGYIYNWKDPLVVEGDFDPVLGVPIAKMTANMSRIVGLVDSVGDVDVYIDSNDLVSFRYFDSMHSVFNYTVQKGGNYAGAKSGVDSFLVQDVIVGTLDIPLFDKIRALHNDDLLFSDMFFSVDAFVKGFVTDSLQEIFRHGVRLYFDSVRLQVRCQDGYSPEIDLMQYSNGVEAANLIDGHHLDVVKNYDISELVNHKPIEVTYTVRLNVKIPVDQWITHDSITYINEIGVDSIVADIRAYADFPLQVYCKDIEYVDTAYVNMNWGANADSVLDRIERMMKLDSTSCIVVEAKNWLPISMHLNISLLDSNMNNLRAELFASDSMIAGAPLKMHPFSSSYVSSGYTKSRIVSPISWELLHDLRKTRALRYSIGASTSTNGANVPHPKVSVQGNDKLELKAYVVVAPHVHLATDPISF